MSLSVLDTSSVLIGTGALLLGIWYFRSKRQNLPPGPTPIPVFGNLISVGRAKSLIEAFYGFQKQYGDIFTIYMGPHPTIVLCGQKMIREAFISNADNFSGRPVYLTVPKTISQNKGIVWSHDWKENRRMTLITLRDFGFGKRSLEERVYEESRRLCEQLESMEGQVVDVRLHLTKAFSNVICTVVFGQRFEYDDPKFIHLLELLDFEFSASGNQSALIDHIPMLTYIPKFRKQFDALIKSAGDIENYFKEIIEEHKQTYDSENLRDFIDLYLKSDPTNERNAMNIIRELFFAGTETSGTTLSWGLLLMAKHPEIQKKCQKEIKEVIGTSRGPVGSDRGTLSYTEATIMEIQRFISIGEYPDSFPPHEVAFTEAKLREESLNPKTPVSIPHTVSEDMTFEGYQLKKDSMVMAFLDSSHHDPEVWPDHDKFRPERWLDDSGKLDAKNSSYMPFSVGRRACLGEQLAKMELFIIFVSVLQRFEFSPVPNKPVSLEGHLGITYGPVDSKLVYRKKDL